MKTKLISIILFLLIVSCGSGGVAEYTATSYLKAIRDKNYEKAKKYADEETKLHIQLLEKINSNLGITDVKNVQCLTNGNVAECVFCCSTDSTFNKIILIRDGKFFWKVHQPKEEPEVGDYDEPTSAADVPLDENILSYPNTEMVPTMEMNITNNKNYIYSSTLLIAWNELKTKLSSSSITSNSKSQLLRYLSTSNSFKTKLDTSEFYLDINKINNEIIIDVKLFRDMSFKSKLDIIEDFKFKNKPIEAFGLEFYTPQMSDIIKIRHYTSDEDFAISIETIFEEDELILMKTNSKFSTFNEVYQFYLERVNSCKNHPKWRKLITNEDVIKIPTMKFNIGKDYNELNNIDIIDDKLNKYKLKKVHQRYALLLSNNGGYMKRNPNDQGIMFSNDKPKKLYFDNDFYIILKKKNAYTPFVMIKIVNTEFMKLDSNL